MSRNFETQLAGQIGESLVVAELGRRNIVATCFAGNVPDIDLLAYRDGKTQHLKVKAWRNGAVNFDARRFLNIKIENNIQTVEGPDKSLDPNLIFVFVKIGNKIGNDKFFILQQSALQLIIQKNYIEFIDSYKGDIPRNRQKTQNSVNLQHLFPYYDNWNIIEQSFL